MSSCNMFSILEISGNGINLILHLSNIYIKSNLNILNPVITVGPSAMTISLNFSNNDISLWQHMLVYLFVDGISLCSPTYNKYVFIVLILYSLKTILIILMISSLLYAFGMPYPTLHIHSISKYMILGMVGVISSSRCLDITWFESQFVSIVTKCDHHGWDPRCYTF